jgi:hypothetical protein
MYLPMFNINYIPIVGKKNDDILTDLGIFCPLMTKNLFLVCRLPARLDVCVHVCTDVRGAYALTGYSVFKSSSIPGRCPMNSYQGLFRTELKHKMVII